MSIPPTPAVTDITKRRSSWTSSTSFGSFLFLLSTMIGSMMIFSRRGCGYAVKAFSHSPSFSAPARIIGIGTRSTKTPLWAAVADTRSLSVMNSTSSSSSSSNNFPFTSYYSQATLDRVEGLDATEEFDKLCSKLPNVSTKDELKEVLLNKLKYSSSNKQSPDKAEYVRWLLSGYHQNEKPKAAPSPARKERKSSGPPQKTVSREVQRFQSTVAAAVEEEEETPQTFATDLLFAEQEGLHPNSKRAIAERLKLTSMTEIQAKTFQAASGGRDVLGRARTGTGKTVAFLLPAIERVLSLPSTPGENGVSIVVISPTRELATQIATQAQELTAFHNNMHVQVMFGGTGKGGDVARWRKKTPTILVATPGRLLDHLNSTPNFKHLIANNKVLVLDETDRLLDMGFRRDIERIMAFMPAKDKRQTLLFSATMPKELKSVMAQTMKSGFVEVDCVNDGEPTNARVQQSHVIIPHDRMVTSVVEVVQKAVRDDPSNAKIVVFFNTARMVNFYAEVFNQGKLLSRPVLELHSKKSQGYRNRVSDEFRKASTGILFTSDVSARGVDYPNVSHVIQFGIPDSREQYIHRLGRTGRANTDGKGWLVLSDWESKFLKELKGVDIVPDTELKHLFDNAIGSEPEAHVNEIRRRIRGGDDVLAKSASGAYQAFLGFYLGQMKRMGMSRKEELVRIANGFASLAGLHEPPHLNTQMVGKMGLKGVSGLNVKEKALSSYSRGGGGGGGDGRSGARPFDSDSRGGGGGGRSGGAKPFNSDYRDGGGSRGGGRGGGGEQKEGTRGGSGRRW